MEPINNPPQRDFYADFAAKQDTRHLPVLIKGYLHARERRGFLLAKEQAALSALQAEAEARAKRAKGAA